MRFGDVSLARPFGGFLGRTNWAVTQDMSSGLGTLWDPPGGTGKWGEGVFPHVVHFPLLYL